MTMRDGLVACKISPD